jgi:hypothetical protein
MLRCMSKGAAIHAQLGDRTSGIAFGTSEDWCAMLSSATLAICAAVVPRVTPIALYTGKPVSRSQTTVVSRWFDMPSAQIDVPFNPARTTACAATPAWVDQISCGSCSTQPGCG